MDREACRTCRRVYNGKTWNRKANSQCDFAKPVCTPCRASGRACTGLGRTLVFKAVNPALPGSTSRQGQAGSVSISSETDQHRYIRLFWDAYLPQGNAGGSAFPEECRQYTTCGWTDIARRYTCVDLDDDGDGDNNTPRVACLAIVANSLCMLGSKHGEEHLLEQGQQVYGRALRGMRASLARFTTSTVSTASTASAMSPMPSTDLAIASRLLTLFAILWGKQDQGDAWAALNAGELALLVARPPSAYQTGDEHQLFVDARMHLLIQSLIARKKSVLSERAWMTEPWALVAKTPLDRVVDLIAQMPELAAALDSDTNRPLVESMFREYLSALAALFDEVARPGVDVLLQDASLCARISKTHTMLVYWTVCLLSRPMLLRVLPADEIPAHVANVRATRFNMLKAMRALFAPEAGWYGVNIALFPLRTLMYTTTADGTNPLSASEAVLLGNIQSQVKGRAVSGFMSSMGSLLGS